MTLLLRRAAMPAAVLLLACIGLAAGAHAQSFSIDLGNNGTAAAGGMTSRIVQLTALMTLLSVAPGILVVFTAFTRIVIVLSILRSALGAQGTPPNPVLIGLALFLTYFVMEPTLTRAWTDGLMPMMHGQIGDMDGLQRTAAPFHRFMAMNTQPKDVRLFVNLAHVPAPATPDATPWRVLAPAFMIGELRRAFEMGFLIYLPFLVSDIVVSSVLMSLGMMMLQPSAISLPFKLIFFVLVDGWQLVAGSLVRSFGAT
jgi:flagellar biosynthesis protein FliP